MFKRLLSFLFLLASLTVFFASCKKESDNSERYYTQATRGYYPLQLGRYVVYDVDSTIWNDFDCTKREAHLQMRYIIADTFTDAQGRPSFRVDVDQRVADTGIWKVSTVFYATPTTTGLEVVMNNLRQTKLIFPVQDNNKWEGNSAIDVNEPQNQFYNGWVYQYSKMVQPYNNGRVTFDNAVIVDEQDATLNDPESMPNAYAERTYAREVYGYDVGMIYRELTHWTYDPGNSANACRKGFSVVMRAIDHN
ncbi:MAG: hypothetical protein JST36_08305 [Bacteroidetes bacterium]|nr:hypothetical protein [Bacteroidota bacterium]